MADRRALFHRTVLFGAIIALTPAIAWGDPVISDRATARQVLGRHALTLQWLGDGTLRTAGTVAVTAKDGHWKLAGAQSAKEGSLILDGEVVAIDRMSFVFEGKVVTQVSYIYEGKPCVREGRFTFLRKGSRKYWRMQPILNPCDDPTADYIDIYLR